jgi:hypothetical protein
MHSNSDRMSWIVSTASLPPRPTSERRTQIVVWQLARVEDSNPSLDPNTGPCGCRRRAERKYRVSVAVSKAMQRTAPRAADQKAFASPGAEGYCLQLLRLMVEDYSLASLSAQCTS